MFRDQGIGIWMVLGTILLLVLNLPESVSRQIKSALREGIAPLQGLVSAFSEDAREAVRSVRGLGDLAFKNRELASEVVALRNEVRHLKEFERENIELREQLSFARRADYQLIPCDIIARDISGWWQTIRLNKGASHGVALQRAVVTSEGVIGQTIDVSVRTSDVMLLSDPSSKVSAQILRSNAFGVISGRGVSWRGHVVLQMEFINKNARIQQGDEVVTSGMGGVFLHGLIIGVVDRVYRDRSGLYQYAEIEPAADFGSLTYAFVVEEEIDPIEDLLRTKKLPGVER